MYLARTEGRWAMRVHGPIWVEEDLKRELATGSLVWEVVDPKEPGVRLVQKRGDGDGR